MSQILTGASLSGSLRDPGTAIPIGTSLAVIVMLLSYAGVILTVGAGTLRSALRDDFFILQEVCISPAVVFIGTLLATFSSALSGIVLGGEVLQAMAKDRLLPGMHVLKKESSGGDPRLDGARGRT